MNKWMYYPDACDKCGADLEVFTLSDEEGVVFENDPVRCTDCGAQGIIEIYDDDAGVCIQWDETIA